MSVDIHLHGRQADTRAPRAPRRWSLARVVATSIGAGTAAALALVLTVVPGATEGVITGAMLVASGAGWGLLAILSSRRTTQPQPWAGLPAVSMMATGLGLMVFTPGDAVLTTANWIWPVAVLALTAWFVTRTRRDMSAGGRRLLTPMMAVLVLASLGATYENVAAVRDNHAYPAPGRMVEVNGHRLHLDCRGHGGPTVVLFNGLGEVSASWSRITTVLARTARVCAYDRAGQGWSDEAEHPQDGVTAARDLNAVLSRAGEQGPFILAGHSIGGTFAMTYAARYPADVAGMVLLDSSSPKQFDLMPDFPGQYAVMRRVYALIPTLNRLGVGRAFAAVAPSHLPADAADRVRAVTATARGARNARDDASMLHQVFSQAQALTSLQGRPLVVLTASGSLDDTTGWAEAQAQLAGLSSNHLHEVVEASHEGILEDAGPAKVATRAISDVVESVRNRSFLEPR